MTPHGSAEAIRPLVVRWISTGGTISKIYDEGTAELRPDPGWRERIGRRLRLPHVSVDYVEPFLKDSLEITGADRDVVAKAVSGAFPTADGVLVTHGTDTLRATHLHVADRLGPPPCPVVFTGAMAPLSVGDSDAVQNLSAAFLALRLLPPGYHVVFHDQVFSTGGYRKNRVLGTFEPA